MHYLTSKVAAPALYQTSFDDGYVVWSPLPWSDYKKLREARLIKGAILDMDLEQYVYDRCVVFSSYDEDPPDYLTDEDKLLYKAGCRDDQPAGIVATVVKNILFLSGSVDPNIIMEQLDRQRAVIDNIEDQLVVAICRAFPSYTPEIIEKMDWQTILKRAAQAEAILMGRTVGLPFQVYSEADAQAEIAKQKFDLQKEIRQSTMDYGPPDEAAMKREMAEARREVQHQRTELREQYLRQRGLG